MDQARLFAQHISHVQGVYERALAELKAEKDGPNSDAVLVHSGSEGIYYADDAHIPFRSAAHFNYWVPVMDRPDQMLLMQPGKKPIYFQVTPTDFWYEQGATVAEWWSDQFQIITLDDAARVIDHLPESRHIAFIGENTEFAGNIGLPTFLQNEKHLLNYLDFHRGMKTAYEVEQIREANRRALVCHEAAYKCFLNGGSEYDIHSAYLAANQMVELDCPYTNIIGLDEKSAILHYQHKRRLSGANSRVLLIDAGCRVNGYCSDITRTYVRDENGHPTFAALVRDMNQLQLDLVELACVGVPYKAIHDETHKRVLDLLTKHKIVSGSREDLEEKGISRLFFPHGIGHLLGLQVHDVGGYFKDETGALAPPPEEHRFLRLNRPMQDNMVFTIEPGLYFIPVLLNPERNSEKGKLLNWDLIDELIPYGGIRFEDNILVTNDGPVNLTR